MVPPSVERSRASRDFPSIYEGRPSIQMETVLPFNVTLPSLSMTTPGAFLMSSNPLEPCAKALWLTFMTTLSIFTSTRLTFSVTVAAARLSRSASIFTSRTEAQISSVNAKTASLYPISDTVRFWPGWAFTLKRPCTSVVVHARTFPSASRTATVAHSRGSPLSLSFAFPSRILSCLAADIVAALIIIIRTNTIIYLILSKFYDAKLYAFIRKRVDSMWTMSTIE